MWTRTILMVLIPLTARMTLAQETGTGAPPTRHLVSSIDVKDFGAETALEPGKAQELVVSVRDPTDSSCHLRGKQTFTWCNPLLFTVDSDGRIDCQPPSETPQAKGP